MPLKTRWKLKKKVIDDYGSQNAGAKAIGMGKGLLSQIITGRINPTDDEKEKINKGLGAEVV